MKIRIVFLDIDGTLFDNENDIVHQSTLDAIDALKKRNIKVCISTGRSKTMCDEVFLRYGLQFDGYVLINGQYVLYNDEEVYRKPLDKQFISDYIKSCEKHQLPYGFLSEKETFVSSHDERVVTAFSNFKMKLPRILSDNDLEKDIFQGLFFDKSFLNYFSQKFETYVKFVPWLGNGADIISKDASKAVGAKVLCEALGISTEEVIAFGDSTNDIELIEFAQIGVAMGNAKDELKQIADYVTDSIENDGLAKALKKYNLI